MGSLDTQWFKTFEKTDDHHQLVLKPIAYFCAEYALSPRLPTYAGGLGILAGDMVYEAASHRFPMVFVGLRYQEGQSAVIPPSISTDRPDTGKLFLLKKGDGAPLLLSLPLHGRTVWYQTWQWQDGDASVYLLDTNVSENDPLDRQITTQLYVEDRELRLKQEIILGIGGHRLLHRLGLHPSVYHLNEGHSAFLALELIHHEMEHQRVDFKTACIYAKQHLLFTNHTIVMAGQELFTNDLVAAVFKDYAAEVRINTADIVELGAISHATGSAHLFSMTMCSFRLSSKANAVSVLHQEKASVLWPTYSMDAITNGVHLPRWDAIHDTSDIWTQHQVNKRKLLEYITQETGEAWDENILLFGWARRLVPYKQPLAFLQDVARLRELATRTGREFRIVVSGPTSTPGVNQLADEVQKLIHEQLKGIAVFLPHYSIPISQLMTAGCDVWLNTPVIGSEACGTSGMKAALNGVLPLSTRDGWVAEIDLSECGWVLDATDDLTAALYAVVEHDIVLMYYDHLRRPHRSTWLAYMKKCRTLIQKQFSMTRAFRQYVQECYIPLLHRKHSHKYE
jgi:glucan phosphorylase